MGKFGFDTPSVFSVSQYNEEYKVTIPKSDATCYEALTAVVCLLRLAGYSECSIKEELKELLDNYND